MIARDALPEGRLLPTLSSLPLSSCLLSRVGARGTQAGRSSEAQRVTVRARGRRRELSEFLVWFRPLQYHSLVESHKTRPVSHGQARVGVSATASSIGVGSYG